MTRHNQGNRCDGYCGRRIYEDPIPRGSGLARHYRDGMCYQCYMRDKAERKQAGELGPITQDEARRMDLAPFFDYPLMRYLARRRDRLGQ